MTDMEQASTNNKEQPELKSTYQKPQTSLFLEDTSSIQGGIIGPLESQGTGYLSS